MNDDGELSVGEVAPAFRLPASSGGTIGLDDYKGRSNVILFFVREFN